MWYRCSPPTNGDRFELSGRNVPQCYVLVRTNKVANLDDRNCYQSDYIDLWSSKSGLPVSRSTSAMKMRFRGLIRITPKRLRVFSWDFISMMKNLTTPWWNHPCIERVPVKVLI